MAYPSQITHGTERGYSTHRKWGEEACAECKAAHSKYNSTAAIKARANRGPRPIPECGTDQRYHRHIRLKETPCDACRQAHAVATREKRKKGYKPKRQPVPRVRMPINLFAELYWTATPKALLMLDDHFGSEKVDELIKRAEEL